MSTARRSGFVITTGIALLVLPIVAGIVKVIGFNGWMMVMLLLGGIVLVAGYVLQIVIAVTGMFIPDGVFRRMSGAGRGIAAAWVTSVSVVLTAFFLVDGGDTGEAASTYMVLTGNVGNPDAEALSNTLFPAFGALWILGYLWLVTEWIIQLVRSRREKRAQPSVWTAQPGTNAR